MLAEFIFTATESKYLIAKAAAKMERVQRAFREGIVALHPSTSTYFIVKELTGTPTDQSGVWINGLVAAEGQCLEANAHKQMLTENGRESAEAMSTPSFQAGRDRVGWNPGRSDRNLTEGVVYF
jgi:hypothetical protein